MQIAPRGLLTETVTDGPRLSTRWQPVPGVVLIAIQVPTLLTSSGLGQAFESCRLYIHLHIGAIAAALQDAEPPSQSPPSISDISEADTVCDPLAQH